MEVAGIINTAPALFWTLVHILKSPRARQEIEEEIQTLLKSKKVAADAAESEDENVTLDDILKLEKKDLDQLIVLGESS